MFKKRKEQQIFMDQVLSKLDDVHAHMIDLTRFTYENIVYSENMPPLKRLSAFKEFLKLGGNGSCKKYAMEKLVLEHKDLWQSLIDVRNTPEFAVEDAEEYYKNTLKEIEDKIMQ